MPPIRPVPTTLDQPGFYRMPVETYHRIIRAGIWGDCAPFELLEGLLVNSPRPLSPRAGYVRMRLNKVFFDLPLVGWFYFPLGAITMAESEPEPDFSIVRGDDDDRDRHRFPGTEEVGILSEVSESSLTFDRVEKGRIYARAGIPVYWIMNVIDRQVEVYTSPESAASPPAYRTRHDYRPGQDVTVVLDGVTVGTIPVADLIA